MRRLLIEPRIYRAAFVPALLAVVIAMFSLESRPAPLQQALAADILFDGRVAVTGARRIATAQPDRRPGTFGDRQTAAAVAARLRSQHFGVSVDRFNDEGKDLVNVVGRVAGQTTRQLVVVAPRDADRVPDVAGSAADTSALLEIARAIEGRLIRKTLVLASVDGSTLGSSGARRLAANLASAGPVEAVIVISDMAVPTADGPLLIPWSQTADRGGLRLQRTLADSVRLEVEKGGAGPSPSAAGQFARLALPVALGDQAPFIEQGLDAMRLSGSGELPPDGQPQPDPDRIGTLGRGTLRAIFAYDAAGVVDEQPSSFLVIAQKRLPSWSVALLVATLLLPLFAATIDGFARVRRRHQPVLPWLRWILAGTVPLLAALAMAEFLVLVGQAPDTPPAPLPPSTYPLDGSAWISLSLCALVLALAWVFVRPRLAGTDHLPALDSPAPAAALALLLCVVSVAVWIVNPWAALALLPAFHGWLLVTASPVPPRRAAGVAIVIGVALPGALVLLAMLMRLSLGPFEGAWYGFLLLTGHQVGLYSAVVTAVLIACFVAAIRITLARRIESPVDDGQSVRGPGGYAGPGSLGGTESALRR